MRLHAPLHGPSDAGDSRRTPGRFRASRSALAIGAAATLLVAGSVAVAVAGPPPAPQYPLVNQDGAAGWHVYKQCYSADYSTTIPVDPSDTVTFVDGPEVAPAGVGSAQLATGNGTSGGTCQAALRSGGFQGVKLSSLTALTYWAYSSQNNGSQFPFLSLNVSTTGGKTVDDTLFFEPPYQAAGAGGSSCANQQATQMNMWQSWDALHGCWWDNNGVIGDGGTNTSSLSAFVAQYPKAVIVNPSDKVGGVRLAVGEASVTDQFQGNIDSLVIGIMGKATQAFNFDPKS